MDDFKKIDVEQTYKTLGGETVNFKSYRKREDEDEEEVFVCLQWE